MSKHNLFLITNSGRVSLKKNKEGNYLLQYVIWDMDVYPKRAERLVSVPYDAEHYETAAHRAYKMYAQLLEKTKIDLSRMGYD